MLRKLLAPLLLALLLGAVWSCRTGDVPDFARAGVVNNPVRDTLFIRLPGFEDEWVKVRIRNNEIDFTGSERVTNGVVWFDIRHLPTNHYTVWIEFGPYSFPQRFWHERAF